MTSARASREWLQRRRARDHSWRLTLKGALRRAWDGASRSPLLIFSRREALGMYMECVDKGAGCMWCVQGYLAYTTPHHPRTLQ